MTSIYCKLNSLGGRVIDPNTGKDYLPCDIAWVPSYSMLPEYIRTKGWSDSRVAFEVAAVSATLFVDVMYLNDSDVEDAVKGAYDQENMYLTDDGFFFDFDSMVFFDADSSIRYVSEDDFENFGMYGKTFANLAAWANVRCCALHGNRIWHW